MILVNFSVICKLKIQGSIKNFVTFHKNFSKRVFHRNFVVMLQSLICCILISSFIETILVQSLIGQESASAVTGVVEIRSVCSDRYKILLFSGQKGVTPLKLIGSCIKHIALMLYCKKLSPQTSCFRIITMIKDRQLW